MKTKKIRGRYIIRTNDNVEAQGSFIEQRILLRKGCLVNDQFAATEMPVDN